MSVHHRMRLLGAVAASFVLTGPTVPVTAAPPAEPVNTIPCRYPDRVENRKDRWVAVKGPGYDVGEGPATMTQLVVSASSFGRMYATNGVSIKRSTDHGCSWEGPIFPAVDAPSKRIPEPLQPVVRADRIHSIAVGQQVGQPDEALWVLGYDESNGVQRPRVWVANAAQAGGGSVAFEERFQGLPQAGKPLALSAHFNRIAGLMIDVATPDAIIGTGVVTPGLGFYITVDGGETWFRRRTPEGFASVDGLRQDPYRPGEYWAWSGSKYAVTRDGTAWSTPVDVGGDIRDISVGRTLADQSVVEIYVADSQRTKVLRSVDGGDFVPVAAAPGDMVTVARGAGDLVALGTRQGVFGRDTRLKRFVALGPKGVGPMTGLWFPRVASGPKYLLGYTADRIYRFQLYKGDLFRPDPRRTGVIGGTNTVFPPLKRLPTSTLSGPVLSTPVREVTVKPDELARVPVEFAVPPNPIPLDIDFVIDSTGSMNDTIDGLINGLHDIVQALTRLNIKAHFGVADFKDVGDVPGRGCKQSTDPACFFSRRLPISPPGLALNNALAQVREGVGGGGLQGDVPEAQTMALDQAVTGSGTPLIPAGREAKFRTGSIKVVMLVTDAHMKQGNRDGTRFPTIPEVVATYKSRDVYMIGITTYTPTNDFEAALRDSRLVAEGTGTFAPPSGVDCNGDGDIVDDDISAEGVDVEPGAPLVCGLPQSAAGAVNITPAVVSLLLALPDPGLVGVDVDAGGQFGVVRGVVGTTNGVFNLRDETRIPFALDVSCTPLQAGKDLLVRLRGEVRGVTKAETSFVVHCRADPLPLPPVIFVPPVVPPRVIVPPLPPPPPPPPVPNPPPNPNPNINPNAGFAQQEEQQFQLAAVGQSEGQQQEQDEEAVEMAMSGLDREEPSPLPVWAASMAMAGATGLMLRRRVQRSEARVRR